MITPPTITVIILTYNESLHIARAIESVRAFSDEVLVVDSFSTAFAPLSLASSKAWGAQNKVGTTSITRSGFQRSCPSTATHELAEKLARCSRRVSAVGWRGTYSGQRITVTPWSCSVRKRHAE